MTPSVYQQGIFDWVDYGRGSAVVDAGPGSGKTTTLVQVTDRISTRYRMAFLAFGKATVEELNTRIRREATIRTLHSLGFGALIRAMKGSVTVEQHKVREIITTEIHPDVTAELGPMIESAVAMAKAHALVDDSPDDDWEMVVDLLDDIPPGDAGTVIQYARHVLAVSDREIHTADFEDMIRLPVLLNVKLPKFDWVLLDEAQDISVSQRRLLHGLFRPGGRLLAVGDEKQCQPPGTLVKIPGGHQVPIESLRKGDHVVSWSRRHNVMIGRKEPVCRITNVARRPYSGQMVTVRAGGMVTRCTPNHRWLARWVDKQTDFWCVYMMKKGRWYRIGWCQVFSKNSTFHLGTRTRIEGADCAWILSVHQDKTEASVQESVTATRYGLPLMPFKSVNGSRHITEESVERFFSFIEGHEHEMRALQCLEDHGRKWEHPFYTPGRMTRRTIFETHACNLIPEHMAIPRYDDQRTPSWHPIRYVSRDHYEGDVYSLEVEKTETYVADNLVTHNSIYVWRGASHTSMDELQHEFGCIRLPLSISYRCPVNVIDYARTLYPVIEPADNAPAGRVCSATSWSPEDFRPGDMILCRNNAPLISAFFALFMNGVPACVLGKNLVPTLRRIVKKIDAPHLHGRDGLSGLLLAWRRQQIGMYERMGKPQKAAAVDDHVEILLTVLRQGKATSIPGFLEEIKAIFQAEGSVRLSTIHRAKGMEADRVFILDADLMPSPYAVESWQLDSEKNLEYVAITRAKQELTFIRTQDLVDRVDQQLEVSA